MSNIKLDKTALDNGAVLKFVTPDYERDCEVWKEKAGGVGRNNYKV